MQVALSKSEARRGVRVVYGDGLENRCPRKGTVGSNPTPSAAPPTIQDFDCFDFAYLVSSL